MLQGRNSPTVDSDALVNPVRWGIATLAYGCPDRHSGIRFEPSDPRPPGPNLPRAKCLPMGAARRSQVMGQGRVEASLGGSTSWASDNSGAGPNVTAFASTAGISTTASVLAIVVPPVTAMHAPRPVHAAGRCPGLKGDYIR